MEGDTNNSAEGREVASSTPPDPGASTTAAGNASSDAAAGSTSAPPAPVSAKDQAAATDKINRAKFERLAAGEEARAVRTSDKAPATPSAEDTPATDPRGAPPPAGELSPAGAKAAPPFEAYGMEEATYRTLDRAKMLPTADEWKELPSWARGQMVSAAKQTLSASQRAFQAAQLVKQNKPAGAQQRGAVNQTTIDGGDGDDELLGQEQIDDDGAAPADQRRPRAAAGAAAAGTGQEARRASPAGQPGQGAAAAPADGDPLEPLFEQMEDYYGGNGEFVTPFRQVVSILRAESDQRVNQVRAEALLNEAVSTFDALEQEIPQLKDAGQRTAVIPLAGALLQQRQALGQRTTFGECCRDAARAQFHPDQRQQAQQDLLERRKTTLQGNVTKVANNANPGRAMSKEEKDKAKFDRLSEGADPREVRSSF